MKNNPILKNVIWKIKRSKVGGVIYTLVGKLMIYAARLIFFLRYSHKQVQADKVVCLWQPLESYSCNQKAIITELLRQRDKKYDIVCIMGAAMLDQLPNGVRGVEYYSKQALYELATAKIWIFHSQSRQMFYRGLYKRRNQILFQTWHGSLGIKTIGTVASANYHNRWGMFLAKKTSGETDFWISNSDWESEIYCRSFPIVKDILLYGHPRNDILIQQGNKVSERMKTELGAAGKKVLLYAPSYRDGDCSNAYNIDKDLLIAALHEKFGGNWVIVFRLHPRQRMLGRELIPGSEEMIDATDYPDIQDLMLGVDVLLTDFSSCIFDFMLTGRPGFIYAPDLEAYNLDRGFYYPLESTPFPIGRTNEELAERILAFDDEKYTKDVAAFLEDKGCIEDGHASERVVQKINELMGI